MIKKVQRLLKKLHPNQQFIPTKEDLIETNNLADRLKSKKPEESLSNVLEWQDRNLRYWQDRALISQILMGLIFLSVMALYLYAGQTKLYFLLVIGLFVLMFFGKEVLNIAYNVIYLFGFIILLIVIIALSVPSVSITSNLLFFLIAVSFLLGAIISTITQFILKYRNIKRFIPDFAPKDTFELSLPVKKILKYRLSICRDYAKLTAALLINIYPKSELYFVLIPHHVATAIKVNDKTYVLDQQLPILTLDNWIQKWKTRFKRKEIKVDLLKIVNKKEEIETEKSIKYQQKEIKKVDKIDIEEISTRIKDILKIKIKKKDTHQITEVKIPFKGYVSVYERDEIVIYSIVESMKNKIEDELCGQIGVINDLIINQEDKDFIVTIKINTL